MAGDEEHDVSCILPGTKDSQYIGELTQNLQGATVQEILIEACRRNNLDLLNDCLEDKSDAEISKLLNETTTVMGNHLYHEAASRGNCAPHIPSPARMIQTS
jgi:hypothetical protein